MHRKMASASCVCRSESKFCDFSVMGAGSMVTLGGKRLQRARKPMPGTVLVPQHATTTWAPSGLGIMSVGKRKSSSPRWRRDVELCKGLWKDQSEIPKADLNMRDVSESPLKSAVTLYSLGMLHGMFE